MADLGGIRGSSGSSGITSGVDSVRPPSESGELAGRKVEIGRGTRILRGIGNALRSFGRAVASLASRAIAKITAPISRLRRAEVTSGPSVSGMQATSGGTRPESFQQRLGNYMPTGLDLRSQDGRLQGSISGRIGGEAGEFVRSFYEGSISDGTLEDGDEEPRLTKEFWKDVDRSTILLGKDRVNEEGETVPAPRVTSEDARESLLAFADDDPTMASNLSRFVFQALGNAIAGGMNQSLLNDSGDNMILGMMSSGDQASQKIRLSRDEEGAFLIDFTLSTKVTGISTTGTGGTLETGDDSTALLTMKVRVTAEELASGNNAFELVGLPAYTLNLDIDEGSARRQLGG
jgi:hypothetical protein